jgi:plastocyanin
MMLLLAGMLTVSAFAAIAIGPVGVVRAGGGGCHAAPAGAGRDATGSEVSMEKNCFLPTVLRVEPGTTVTFRNADPSGVFHELAGVAMTFGSADIIRPAESVTAVFEEPGVYPYACRLHFGMVGAIVVGDGKFDGAVTGARNGASMTTQDTRTSAVAPAPVAGEPTQAVVAKDDSASEWWYAAGGLVAGATTVGTAGGAWLVKRRRE